MSLISCEITKAEMTHFWRQWFFLNMPFTKEDKILIKKMFELKGYNDKHLVREFFSKGWNVSSIYKVLQWLRVTELVSRHSGSARWCIIRIDLDD